ncbi:hypothetical protein ACOJBO_08430 [Rhizobium beringeri]
MLAGPPPTGADAPAFWRIARLAGHSRGYRHPATAASRHPLVKHPGTLAARLMSALRRLPSGSGSYPESNRLMATIPERRHMRLWRALADYASNELVFKTEDDLIHWSVDDISWRWDGGGGARRQDQPFRPAPPDNIRQLLASNPAFHPLICASANSRSGDALWRQPPRASTSAASTFSAAASGFSFYRGRWLYVLRKPISGRLHGGCARPSTPHTGPLSRQMPWRDLQTACHALVLCFPHVMIAKPVYTFTRYMLWGLALPKAVLSR